MSKRGALGQSGQAILEYTLLVVISLAILGGVIYQFNDAFRVYAQKLFVGEYSYMGCLIKNGILPGADGEACPPPQFNMKDGKQLANNGQGAGANNSNNNSTKGANSNSANSSGRASEVTSNTIAFNSADSKNTGLKSDSIKDGKGKGDKSSTGNDGFSSSSTSAQGEGSSENASGSFSGGRGRKPITSDDSIKEKGSTSVPLTDRDMKSARELAAEKKKKSKIGDDASATDLSFGNIFKYLVIAALVFGIIFFIGSQFLAVSRSKRRK